MSWVPVTGDHAQAAYLARPRQALEQAREEALTPHRSCGEAAGPRKGQHRW